MRSGPSKTAEAVVAVFVPPACREEVLGDLHERYRSPGQYGLDAIRTVPLVILSRIRRTADPQVLLMQAFALYVSFLAAAWLNGRALLSAQWGLLRLAIPACMAMVGLILEDAYAKPGRRSGFVLARGPVLGLGLALVSQGMFRVSNPDLAVPTWITFYGCAMSLLLSSAVRILFPPTTDQLLGANVPAHWLKQSGGSLGSAEIGIWLVKGVAAIVAAAVIGTWMAELAGLPKARVVTLLLMILFVFQVRKRGLSTHEREDIADHRRRGNCGSGPTMDGRSDPTAIQHLDLF
jgi:hypothetical protein